MKLWEKEAAVQVTDIQKRIEEFTVGSDKHWDLCLAEADIKGSLAHAEMLTAIGLLTREEFVELRVEDHQTDIDDAHKAAAAAQNAEVKSFVEKSIPELQKHLDRAQALQKKFSGTRS